MNVLTSFLGYGSFCMYCCQQVVLRNLLQRVSLTKSDPFKAATYKTLQKLFLVLDLDTECLYGLDKYLTLKPIFGD